MGEEATYTLFAMDFAILKQPTDACHQLEARLQVLSEDLGAFRSTCCVPEVMLAGLIYDLILLERDLSQRARPSPQQPGRAVFVAPRGRVTLNLGLLSTAVRALNTIAERKEMWALPSS